MRTTRKRSAAITLVLAGGAALSGCGEPESQRDVYTKLDDCQRDWGNPVQCEPVRDGRYSSTYFYGPRYYGSSFPSGRPRPSANALEAAFAGRGGVVARSDTERGTSSGSGTSSSRSSWPTNTAMPGSSSWPGSGTAASRSTSSGSSSVSRSGFGSSARASSSGG